MDITKLLIDDAYQNYKCYDTLKELLKKNETFRNQVMTGYCDGKISGFNEELWNKIRTQNIRRIRNFEDVFRDGANIGYCTVASKQLSYSLNHCYLCGGVLPILIGTKNCEDGSHTWISYDHQVIDTTLMLIIDEEYAKILGYQEQNRYNPNLDPVYLAAKDFTLDPIIGRKK